MSFSGKLEQKLYYQCKNYPMGPMPSIDALDKYLDVQNLTQKKFGEEVGLSVTTIHNILAGKVTLNYRHIKKLRDYFKKCRDVTMVNEFENMLSGAGVKYLREEIGNDIAFPTSTTTITVGDKNGAYNSDWYFDAEGNFLGVIHWPS